MTVTDQQHDKVLVVDLGAQYAQLIARRVREAHVYSEIVPRTMPFAEMLAMGPKAIILSGGPASVHVDGAPSVDPEIYASGIPLLGICYGAQLLARDLGGTVAKTGRGEYGRTELTVGTTGPLFRDQPVGQPVWMSHFDTITDAPTDAVVLASTPDTPAAAFGDPARRCYGVQFHPEVAHTEHGQEILKAFLYDVAECRPTWTNVSIIEEAVAEIQAQVGEPSASSAGSRAASTRPSPPRSCTRRSATSSRASSSTPACSGSTRPSRWRRRSAGSSTWTSCT